MQYLLGTLSEEERERLEESYFADDKEFEELEIAEEELIDRYVRGELSKQDCDRLVKTLARSPRLVERVQFARVFAKRLVPETVTMPAPAVEKHRAVPERVGWWQQLFGVSTASRAPALAFAFSALVLMLGGATLLVAYVSVREQSRQLAAQQAALEQRQRELDKQAADLKKQTDELAERFQLPSQTPAPPEVVASPSPQSVSRVVYLALSAGSTRSLGASNSTRISPGASELQLTLNLQDADYPSYRTRVVNADRGEVFSSSGLRPQVTRSSSTLTLRVPANRLPPGDYYVSVDGGPQNESVADYPFRVIK